MCKLQSLLHLTDLHNAVPHAHHVVHICRQSVW